MAINPYKQDQRLGVGVLSLLVLGLLLKKPSSVLKTNAAALYTTESAEDDPHDPNKPMWHNLGYWKTARHYADAGQAMARYLGQAAGLKAGDVVLDAGCGCAVQDVFWCRAFDLKHLTAVDITPRRIELGRTLVANAQLEARVDVRLGSATDLPFPDGHFDKVVALESAFHFGTREQFFREAFRVLRPGGRLAVADMVPSAKVRRSLLKNLLIKIIRRSHHIPEANMYDRAQYARRLARQGFEDVHIENISDYVFPGFARQRGMFLEGQDWWEIEVDLKPQDFVADRWVGPWRDLLGFDEYIIATASKPGSDVKRHG